jgi:predicted esterase
MLFGRREFLAVALAGVAPWQAPTPPGSGPPVGQSPLGLSDDGRDGIVYIPKSYREDTPAPLLIMLHGFAGWADEMTSTYALAEEFGVVVIAPESRSIRWGQASPGFDDDVRYIGAAYRKVTRSVNVDPDRVGLGGRSDGAGYALSMGLAYGDIFNHLIILAGGQMTPIRRKGTPKIFIAHGVRDMQMPVELTGRLYATRLKEDGYDVTYREHDGGHATPAAIVREAFAWLVKK